MLFPQPDALLVSMSDVATDLIPALRALAVSLSGVLLAYWWYQHRWYLAAALVLGLLVVGVVLERIGESQLPGRPVAATRLMEWWMLVPMAAGVAAAAAVIIVSVALTLPDTVDDPAVKETVGAITAGITAFLTSSLISTSADKDHSAVGDRIKTRLRRHYTRDKAKKADNLRFLPADSDGEKYLYSDLFNGLSGWDRPTRLQRAAGLAKYLAAHPEGS